MDCLGYHEQVDEVGGLERLPVLIHDMPKVHVKGRRLPIVEDTAALIREQQAAVRDRFPDTRAADLALFPTTKLYPRGETSIQGGLMAKRIHRWALSLAPLRHPDTGEEFPVEKIHPYAFRHTYAQRLADNGTNLEVLAALMGHSDMETTRTYYRVTAKRKREAIRAVASLQLDKNGRKTRSLAVELAESEEYRDHIGQVAVVFGSCVEPHNVRAHGRGCPFRHQCFGCSHFRTDPSYLPELRNHLAALLADKERLRSELPQLEDWARRDAMPSDEEIESVRRLIGDCEAELEELDPVDRARIAELVQTLRRGRQGPLRRRAGRVDAPGQSTRALPVPQSGTGTGTDIGAIGMSDTAAMIAKRKQASVLALDRVRQELHRCHDSGEVISMAELARRARVSRTSLYRNPAMVSAIEQTLGAVTADLAQRAERDGRTTATSLRTDLSNAKATIRRQGDQVAALERALSQAMGASCWINFQSSNASHWNPTMSDCANWMTPCLHSRTLAPACENARRNSTRLDCSTGS